MYTTGYHTKKNPKKSSEKNCSGDRLWGFLMSHFSNEALALLPLTPLHSINTNKTDLLYPIKLRKKVRDKSYVRMYVNTYLTITLTMIIHCCILKQHRIIAVEEALPFSSIR